MSSASLILTPVGYHSVSHWAAIRGPASVVVAAMGSTIVRQVVSGQAPPVHGDEAEHPVFGPVAFRRAWRSWQTDDERTVSDRHIVGIAVPQPDGGRHESLIRDHDLPPHVRARRSRVQG